MRLSGKRSSRLLEILLIAAWASSSVIPAFADEMHQFNVPAEPASAAIRDFASQAKVEILVAGESVQNKRLHAVTGELSTAQGLKILLADSGLAPRYVGARSIALVSAANQGIASSYVGGGGASRAQHAKEGKRSSSRAFRMAQVGGTASQDAAAVEQSSKAFSALQEITVTAQKYRQSALDVPISLDVISGQELLEHGITDLSNLQFNVPGLYMNSTGYSHSVYLRGVGNTNGTDAMVGEYINDADITAEGANGAQGYANGDDGLYDLSRVEVLRGPQGTLYGDGSMGGVIRYITNKPELDAFQMSADVAALFTEYGAPGQRIETMLNTPIVAGTFGLRFAALFEHDGGWVDEPAANQENINDGNVTDVRIEALWQPTADFKANAMQIIHRHSYGLGMGEDADGNITPPFDTTVLPHSTDNSDLSNITLTYDFSGAQLLNSSTYAKEEQSVRNFFNVESVGPVTYSLLFPLFADSGENFSDELRLVDSGRGSLRWSVGAFYKDYRSQVGENYYFGVSGSALSSALHLALPTELALSTSRAGFANVSYDLLARITVGAGVRYTQDYERLVAPDFPFSGARFTSTDPRFYLQYRLTQDINTYVSASKGFRSGGFNFPPLAPYQPEGLWSYELGTKISAPEKGLRADIAVFLSNYSNFVQTADVAPFFPSENIGNARIEGVDADLTWRPTSRWRLSANTEILDTKFLASSAISGYAVGNRLPYAPKYSFTTSVRREFGWGDRPGDAEIYYYEISRVQIRIPGALYQSDIAHFLNARADINWTDNLRLGLFVHNLLNDRAVQSPDVFDGGSVRPRPRTFGVEFNMSVR